MLTLKTARPRGAGTAPAVGRRLRTTRWVISTPRGKEQAFPILVWTSDEASTFHYAAMLRRGGDGGGKLGWSSSELLRRGGRDVRDGSWVRRPSTWPCICDGSAAATLLLAAGADLEDCTKCPV